MNRRSLIAIAIGVTVVVYLCSLAGSWGGLGQPPADPRVYQRLMRELPDIVGNMLDNVRDSTFTMFAPSKEAFRQLAHQTNGHYLDRSSHDALLDLVASHILPGVITVDHIPAHGLKMASITGRELTMTVSHGRLMKVNGIPVDRADLRVGKGVVHTVSRLLLTPTSIADLGGPKGHGTSGRGGGHHEHQQHAPPVGVHTHHDPRLMPSAPQAASHPPPKAAAKSSVDPRERAATSAHLKAKQEATSPTHDPRPKTALTSAAAVQTPAAMMIAHPGEEEDLTKLEAMTGEEGVEDDVGNAGAGAAGGDGAEQDVLESAEDVEGAQDVEGENKIQRDSPEQEESVTEGGDVEATEVVHDEEGEEQHRMLVAAMAKERHEGHAHPEGRGRAEHSGGAHTEHRHTHSGEEHGTKEVGRRGEHDAHSTGSSHGHGHHRLSFGALSKLVEKSVPCAGHGLHDEKHNRCSCAAVYKGANCDEPVAAGPGHRDGEVPRPFQGNYVLNQQHLENLNELKTETSLKTLMIVSNITWRIREQLNAMLPATDVLHGRFYRRCALVASAGVLLRSHLGETIDAHDMVMRFNAAPTKGYEHYVGTKTTYRISNGEHLGFRELPDETVIHHLRSHSFLIHLLWFNIKFPDKMPNVIDPDFAAYVANSVDSIPSSGYFAILLALQMCHEVNLFGFYASNRHGSRHHYYNSEVPSNSNRDEQEFDKVQRLVANGLVKFGDPCVVECHASQQECETCWGVPLEELAMREQYTPYQRNANAKREARWKAFVKWDWTMDQEYEWSDVRGLVPIPPARQAANAEKRKEAMRAAHAQAHAAKVAAKVEGKTQV